MHGRARRPKGVLTTVGFPQSAMVEVKVTVGNVFPNLVKIEASEKALLGEAYPRSAKWPARRTIYETSSSCIYLQLSQKVSS
jgi:hypothetical protein